MHSALALVDEVDEIDGHCSMFVQVVYNYLFIFCTTEDLMTTIGQGEQTNMIKYIVTETRAWRDRLSFRELAKLTK